MYRYLVAFALLTPLIGIWLVEGGEYAGSVGVEGSPNGATYAFSVYVAIVVAVALLSVGKKVPPPEVTGPEPAATVRFKIFARKLLVFDAAFLAAFLFGFGAINVWSGLGKGEFRVGLGAYGAIPNMMTKFIVPALLAYAAILYSRTSRRGASRLLWVANLLVAITIGASWGFKSTSAMVLLPAILLLGWRIRPKALIALATAFGASLVLFFEIFDTAIGANTDVGTFFLRRLTVLQGDVSWYLWGLYSEGQAFPNYWPTLLAGFGDKVLSGFGLSRSNTYEWMLYHYDWMLAYLGGLPLEASEGGHSIVGAPFSEGLIAGGLAGVAVFALVAGLLIGRMYRFLDQSLRHGRDVRAAIGATYFCFCIFPWMIGGGTVVLYHISTLISVGATLAALSVMRRRWVVKVPEPALTPA